MASSTTLKELSKAIKDFMVQPTVPLPDHLIETIAAYLRRHQKYDESASDRLQEELLLIFDKYVRGNPATTGAWLGIMRRLLPVLQTPERILVFFDACKGLLDKISHNKNVVNETMAALMDLVTHAEEYRSPVPDDHVTCNPIIDRLLAIWLERFYPGHCEGSPNFEHIERMTRDALCHFGKKRPKEFFASVHSFFLKKHYRNSILRFFCDFLQSQPPHLHEIMQTPLFTGLLTCLQQDTSTTVVSAAITALVMLLPHMPSDLVPHLPTLFNIYARLLFWERERTAVVEPPPQDADQTNRWEVCSHDPEVKDAAIPLLLNYYTILYGLYPINFMDYIRKPYRYMRHAKIINPGEIEVQPTEIRQRSEQFRRRHLLHPNFYTLTIETEKTDLGRWMESEAAEVVADCMGLCISAQTELFVDQADLPHILGPLDAAADEDADKGLDPDHLSSSVTKVNSWRNTHLLGADSISSGRSPSPLMRRSSLSSQRSPRGSGERLRETAADSPTLPPERSQSPSHTQLQDLIKSNKVIKSSLNQTLGSESVPSLALSHQESLVDRPATSTAAPARFNSPAPVADGNAQIAHLQRQMLLLQNDLSFERYLKQQHMAHIGELRRRQMAEITAEAETQKLLMMNRNLKGRFEEAKQAEMQIRKQSERSRALAKKWEADLANKVKILREDSKKTHAELEFVRKELEESKLEGVKLRKLVCDAEVRELSARQNMQSIEIHSAETDRLKAEVERLTLLEKDHQAKESERQATVDLAETAQNQVEALKMRLEAADLEVRQRTKQLQDQVASLQEQILRAQEERDEPGAKANSAFDSMLAANKAKQAEQDQQYKSLLRKYTALQSTLLDMQSETTPRQQQAQPEEQQAQHRIMERYRSSDLETEYGSMPAPLPSGPGLMRPKPRRLLSEAEIYNMAPGQFSAPSPTSSILQPLQLSVSAGAERSSPEQRLFSGE